MQGVSGRSYVETVFFCITRGYLLVINMWWMIQIHFWCNSCTPYCCQHDNQSLLRTYYSNIDGNQSDCGWLCSNQLNWMSISGRSRISPRRGRQLPRGANIRFCQIFPKTAWNWKNLGPQGGMRVPRAPLRSATVPLLIVILEMRKCYSHVTESYTTVMVLL